MTSSSKVIRSSLFAVPLLSACTNQQLYNGIQQNQQLECQKLPGSQYEKCMQEVSEPYEAYQRDYEELVQDEGR